ncbi:MAG: 16S rRNA (uracil(1498)-N(3))-methyltransferase [Negativibacillus sp.]|nr:16S rRNA (uracil(1498)-N(3))-methyltransferase [Negativibacillus sp.]
MPRFFTQTISAEGGIISGDDAKHISRVLRMKVGEALTACDTKGYDYDCLIESLSDREVSLRVLEVRPSQSEPDVRVILYQAMPKGDKLELIIQKAVELGVDSITPVMTRRCVSKPDSKSMAKKLERYNRIALEAAKQSGRGKVPQVCPMLDLPQALDEMAQTSCPILFYENATAPAKQVIDGAGKEIAVLIGSEGGFDESEVELAIQKGCQVLSLGKRILRCETAPLAALSIIMFETGNM